MISMIQYITNRNMVEHEITVDIKHINETILLLRHDILQQLLPLIPLQSLLHSMTLISPEHTDASCTSDLVKMFGAVCDELGNNSECCATSTECIKELLCLAISRQPSASMTISPKQRIQFALSALLDLHTLARRKCCRNPINDEQCDIGLPYSMSPSTDDRILYAKNLSAKLSLRAQCTDTEQQVQIVASILNEISVQYESDQKRRDRLNE